MNRRMWVATTVIAAMCLAPFAGASQTPAAPEIKMTGKWASDAAILLKKWRDKVDNLTPAELGLFSVDGPLPNSGFGPGGGLNPGPIGGPAGGIRGGRGRNFAQRGGAASPAARAGNTGNDPANALPAPELPEGPAVTFDIKVDKNGGMTGSVVLSLDTTKDEKYKVEKGKVEGKTFRFVTLQKYSGLSLPTEWKGEMLSDNLMAAIRLLPSGAPADEEPFALRRLLK